MLILDRNGNTTATAVVVHPNGTPYLLQRRDVPGHQIRLMVLPIVDGVPQHLQVLHVWADPHADLSDIPTETPRTQVEGPLGDVGIGLRPDGRVVVVGSVGETGYAKLMVDVLDLHEHIPPWTPGGSWPVMISSRDDDARAGVAGLQTQLAGLESIPGTLQTLQNELHTLETAVKLLHEHELMALTPDQLRVMLDAEMDMPRSSFQDRLYQFLIKNIYGQLEPGQNPANLIAAQTAQEVANALVSRDQAIAGLRDQVGVLQQQVQAISRALGT